jgi:hypothetical protein
MPNFNVDDVVADLTVCMKKLQYNFVDEYC